MKTHLKAIKWFGIMVLALLVIIGLMEYSTWLCKNHPVVAAWIVGLGVTAILYICIYTLIKDNS